MWISTKHCWVYLFAKKIALGGPKPVSGEGLVGPPPDTQVSDYAIMIRVKNKPIDQTYIF